ncbi:MAG: biotin/lipoyl-binding protein, partial [Planctomycetota bacterium]
MFGLSAQETSLTSSDSLDLEQCTAILIEDIDLPALESGQIKEVFVKPGDYVQEGAVIAQMDDSRSQHAMNDAQLRLDIANERANDDTEVEAAQKRYRLAWDENKKMAQLRRSGSKSEYEAERARVSAELANL